MWGSGWSDEKAARRERFLTRLVIAALVVLVLAAIALAVALPKGTS
jgi:type IV secretory pathway component VirB8